VPLKARSYVGAGPAVVDGAVLTLEERLSGTVNPLGHYINYVHPY
jgi:hypothetical protein